MARRLLSTWTIALVCLWLSRTKAQELSISSISNEEILRRLQLVERRGIDQDGIIKQLTEKTETQNKLIQEQNKRIDQQTERIDKQSKRLDKQNTEIDMLRALLSTNSQQQSKNVKHGEVFNRVSASTLGDTIQRRFLLDGESTVAFHARINKGAIEHIGLTQRLIFDITVLNMGNGYHNSSGIFTAPSPGLYFFSLSVCILHTGNDIHAEMMKNGVRIAGSYANGNDQGSVSVIVPLVTGDEVWVSSLYHPDTYLYGDTLTSFMGFIVSNF